MKLKMIIAILVLNLAGISLHAAENDAGNNTEQIPNPRDELSSLDKRIQDLKQNVLDLNRDLFLLEEELLFPSNTQVSVFLSIDIGNLFSLDSVQLRLDDKIVANHLYTDREVDALKRGGVQRLYLGNLSSGQHELTAFFTGVGPNSREYKTGTTIKLEKTSAPQYVELVISDNTVNQQPAFKTRIWE